MNRITRGVLLAGLSAAALGAPISATYAQQAPRPAQSAPALDEIIVTAQKRSENLQSVPLAVSAINAKQIEQKFGRDISELGGLAPNLVVDPLYGAAAASISIRGLQLNDGEKSFDPAVAVYLDGVYLATNTGALLNVFDADAVEVLRGPQGTLFGRNTIGGLINVRRKEPTGEFGGKVIGTYGRFEQADLKGVINLPSFLDGLISTKFAITSLNGGGYFHNVTRNKREGNNDLMMYSTGIKIQPSPDAKLVINYDYIDDHSPTRPVTAPTSVGELFCPTAGAPGCGQPVSDANYHREPTTAVAQPQYSKTHSVVANGQVDVAPGQSIVAVVGYRSAKENSFEKFDGVAANLFYTVRPQTSNQFSTELRYQGDIGPAKIVLGGYYFHSYYFIHQQTFFFGGEVPAYETYQTTRNYAGFGQVDLKIFDNLTATVGGRYSVEKKGMCEGQATGLPGSRVLLSAAGDCSDSVKGSNLYQRVSVDPVTGTSFVQTGKARFSSFTPKVGLTYKFPNGIAYATYSKGNRSGGFNGRATDAFTMGPYRPEKVTNYEVGMKSQWLDNRIQINLTAFNLDYKDKQEAVVLPDPVAVTVTVVQNAAAARVRGLEGEFKAIPVQGLTLGASFGYLDAKYKNWTVMGFNLDPATSKAQPFVTLDKSNFKLQRAPRWSFNVNATYEYELANSAKLVFGADYNWKDDYYIIANTTSYASVNPGLVKAFGILNASVSYQTPSWQISVFGKNLGNVDYFQHALDVGTLYGGTPSNSTPVAIPGLWTYATIGAPRTYGVELQFKF